MSFRYMSLHINPYKSCKSFEVEEMSDMEFRERATKPDPFDPPCPSLEPLSVPNFTILDKCDILQQDLSYDENSSKLTQVCQMQNYLRAYFGHTVTTCLSNFISIFIFGQGKSVPSPPSIFSKKTSEKIDRDSNQHITFH